VAIVLEVFCRFGRSLLLANRAAEFELNAQVAGLQKLLRTDFRAIETKGSSRLLGLLEAPAKLRDLYSGQGYVALYDLPPNRILPATVQRTIPGEPSPLTAMCREREPMPMERPAVGPSTCTEETTERLSNRTEQTPKGFPRTPNRVVRKSSLTTAPVPRIVIREPLTRTIRLNKGLHRHIPM
jgi:hypothetical protein